jgi:hypothetical protein
VTKKIQSFSKQSVYQCKGEKAEKGNYAVGVAQVVSTEFKSQYCQKKNLRREIGSAVMSDRRETGNSTRIVSLGTRM